MDDWTEDETPAAFQTQTQKARNGTRQATAASAALLAAICPVLLGLGTAPARPTIGQQQARWTAKGFRTGDVRATRRRWTIYTQIALAAVDRLVLPVMADDSSRRAVQNAFSLVYGLKLPSEIYATYAFATRLTAADRSLPQAHIIAKNRLTQYMGPASAYGAVLRSIDQDVEALLNAYADKFTFGDITEGVVDIRDFQTTGVVAFARGCPFYRLQSGRLDVMGQRIQVNEPYRIQCVDAMEGLVKKL